MRFSLKDLCLAYSKHSGSVSDCCNVRTNYLIANKNNYKFENLDESDIKDLRPYLQCDILAIYEYLAIKDNVEMQDWFYNYSDVYCKKEDNDEYKVLKLNPIAPENADKIYYSMLERSIEPFKSRGIAVSCFDYTV